MGEKPAETVKQIDETRARLDRELDELESRLPGRTTFRRVLRLAFGGGIGTMLFWIGVRRLRRRGRSHDPSSVTPPPPMPVEVHVVPEDWQRAVAAEQAKAFALAIVTAWLGMKVLSLRRSEQR